MEQQINDQFVSRPVSQLPKPKTVKSFWVIILLVLVLVLVSVLVWQRNIANQVADDALQKQVISLQNQIIKLQSKSLNPIGETAEWKTYVNITHKYKLEYPISWFADDKDDNNVNLTNLQYVDVAGNSGPVTKYGSYFLIRVYDLTVPKYKESWPIGVHDISNLKDGLISIMPPFRTDNPSNIAQDVYFTNGNFGYIFQFGSGSEEECQKDWFVFQKIVDSFKFTK